MRLKTRNVLILCLLTSLGVLLWTHQMRADSWGLPTPEHWSANRKFVLRVNDDKRTLTLKEKRANGFLLRWSIPYPQAESPVGVYFTDDGRYTVLRDRWGQVGRGKVLVFLGQKGNVLKSYTLEQILTDEEILHAPHTVSSIWWSSDALFFFRRQQKQFAFLTKKGTLRVFDLKTGQKVKLTDKEEKETRRDALLRAREDLASADAARRSAGVTIVGMLQDKESIPRARQLLASKDPDQRSEGAKLVGMLGDKDSISALKQLLDDRTVTGSGSYTGKTFDSTYDVQLAAGGALLKLLRADAVPLIEPKLRSANRYMLCQWIQLLEEHGVGRHSATLKNLIASPHKEIRQGAASAFLKDDDGTALRQNLQWLKHGDPEVRYRAVRILSEHARQDEANLLRAALKDSDSTNALWALRGLIRLNPPDLDKLLRQCAQRRSSVVTDAAIEELARRGDAAQQKRTLRWVQSLEKHTHQKEGWGSEEMELEKACRALAEAKPQGCEAALRAASKNSCPRIQRPAFGVLAALGDKMALQRVRTFARKGHALDRAQAIEWLGICKDKDSLNFLKDCLKNEEPWIREAAQKALKMMEGQK